MTEIQVTDSKGRPQNLNIVVDTGAVRSIIQNRTVTKLGTPRLHTVSDPELFLKSATGALIKQEGEVSLDFRLAQGKFRWNFIISELALKADIVLGMDFLKSHSLCIDSLNDVVVQVRPRLRECKLLPYVISMPSPVSPIQPFKVGTS